MRKKQKSEEDCPQVLIRMARTKWQKQVAIEFLNLNDKMNEVSNSVKHLKWLIYAMFTGVFINIIVGLIV